MKITAKQFALSLYEAVTGKPAAQVKSVIKKFVELLAEKNMLSLADKIVAQFVKIWNEKRGIVETEVVSANNLNKETIKLLKNYIIKLSGVKEVVVDVKANKGLLSGVIIRYGDRVLDGSLKTRLEELKSELIK
ncbi:MAG: ATP synthase F1 subunit delta [Parcubacteria group bacterium CG2_30_45_37]|nr:MAG: ATP synthase F1 subunit delta [Parcubacteria group bacterium CG2_30_45_37]